MPKSDESATCLVRNLASARGRRLNGLAASFDPTAPAPRPGRVAAAIDGVPSRLSLKPENLLLAAADEDDGGWHDLAVTVGRKDLRSRDFNGVVVDQRRGTPVFRKKLDASFFDESGSAAPRSHGILLVLAEYLDGQNLPKRGNVMFHLTDLNLALLLNSYASDGKMVKGFDDGPQNELAERVGKSIISNSCKRRTILFKYSPFRIHRGDHPPDEVLGAVKSSQFHIYPCPCETYLDALEVRFLRPGRSTHSFFLDFGQGETVQYVKHVYSMDDMDRFYPAVLADVDPQMFWSAVLHSKAVVKVLKSLPFCPEDLIKEWTKLCGAYIKSVVSFKEICFSASEAVRVLPDSEGKWNLINDKIHYNIAYRNAKLAIVMSMSAWKSGEKGFATIEIMDNYIGTDIDAKVAQLAQALKSRDIKDVEFIIEDILRWSETETCDYCGVQNKKMYDCSKCRGAGYCSTDCQRAAWPAHKQVCKTIKRETQKEGQAKSSQGAMKSKIYSPRKAEKSRAQPQLFAEASGLGGLRILYIPMIQGMPNNMITFKGMKKNTIFKLELATGLGGRNLSFADLPRVLMNEADDVRAFKDDLSNLDPIMRLCLACGPLPNLETVKATIDDAIAQANGNLLDIKMMGVGFTPLEWASKKGHLDVVNWLLSDQRTKSLIHVGTPAGWAAYTGRLKVLKLLVQHGASPNATNEVFWNSRPPMLAAAENGKIDSVKYLVEECGVPITTKWRGNGIREHVLMSPNWDDQEDHLEVLAYAKRNGVK